jgi:hypothetical protein
LRVGVWGLRVGVDQSRGIINNIGIHLFDLLIRELASQLL